MRLKNSKNNAIIIVRKNNSEEEIMWEGLGISGGTER